MQIVGGHADKDNQIQVRVGNSILIQWRYKE